VRDDIPIAVASLTPKSVAVTAELADGWLPVFYHPTKAKQRWGAALEKGFAKRAPERPPLQIFAGGGVGIGEGLEPLRDRARPMAALYIGGMGARGKNFYNDVFASYGYEAEARQIQDLYLAGQKAEAAAAIPQEFLDETSLIGPEPFVRDRLQEYRESGVNALNVALVGDSLQERIATLDRLRNLIETL
jgi:alkanesulfonate monooxygenase SsuD/methylene tetrahydromethanopterin reductase-like flavin-dependent oxidoreductase (luciferase family)